MTRRSVLGAVAVVAVVSGALVWRLTAHDSGRGSWRPMERSPLSARHGALTVWTGDEVFVWGGVSGGLDSLSTPLEPVGAMLDERTGRWRPIATAPPGVEGSAATCTAVWTGSAVLVWCGKLALYDPATDAWRLEPEPPGDHGSTNFAVWDGTELLTWGDPSLAFDPSTSQWRWIDPGRGTAMVAGAGAWTGLEYIVWGGVGPDANDFRSDGYAYDPRSETTRHLAPSPLAPRLGVTVVWTGRQLFVWGGEDPEHGGLFTDGALYDPDADTWTTVAASPLDPRQPAVAVWTGSEVVLWGGKGSVTDKGINAMDPRTAGRDDGAAFNPAKGTWRRLPGSPLSPRLAVASVWTGDELFVLGGEDLPMASLVYDYADGATYHLDR